MSVQMSSSATWVVVLQIFLGAYLVAGIGAQHLSLAWLTVIVLLSCLLFVTTMARRWLGLWVLGCVWGGYFHAPAASEPAEQVIVIASSFWSGEQLIVYEPETAQRFALKGRASFGAEGALLCRNNRCRFKSNEIIELEQPFAFIEQNWQGLEQPVYGWLYAVLLGQMQWLTSEVWQSFKLLGWVHLLVVSGLHFSFFAQALAWFVEFPLRCGYVLNRLSPQTWLWVRQLSMSCVAMILTWFAVGLGLTSPVQRALLIFLVARCLPMFLGYWPRWAQWTLVLAIQFCCFPVNALSQSWLLSWSAYMIICAAYELPGWWMRLIMTQGALLLMSAAVLEIVSPIWLLSAWLGTLFFPVVFLLTFLVGLCGMHSCGFYSAEGLEFFLDMAFAIGRYSPQVVSLSGVMLFISWLLYGLMMVGIIRVHIFQPFSYSIKS